jgi:Cys-tRNA(Pro)/Cys-tRNA(Cys) deacylase
VRGPEAGAGDGAAHGRSNGTGDGGHSRPTNALLAASLRCQAVAATPAVRVLERARVAHALHPYDPEHPSDQGHGDARVDGALTIAVVPVSGTLDLKALAAAVGGRKAAMADPADAERTTGYVLGGISPLGQRKALPTVVDESALEFPTVMVSAGRRGLQVELPPADLVRLTRARTAPIGR